MLRELLGAALGPAVDVSRLSRPIIVELVLAVVAMQTSFMHVPKAGACVDFSVLGRNLPCMAMQAR